MNLIVGEAPAQGMESYDALVPASRSGARLAALAGVPDIRLLASTTNLTSSAAFLSTMSALDQRRRATDIVEHWQQYFDGDEVRLVLCGRKVARAFAVPDNRSFWQVHPYRAGWRVMVIPHPSGRSRWWNQAMPGSTAREEGLHALRRFLGPCWMVRVLLDDTWHTFRQGVDLQLTLAKLRDLVPGDRLAQVWRRELGRMELWRDGTVRHIARLELCPVPSSHSINWLRACDDELDNTADLYHGCTCELLHGHAGEHQMISSISGETFARWPVSGERRRLPTEGVYAYMPDPVMQTNLTPT